MGLRIRIPAEALRLLTAESRLALQELRGASRRLRLGRGREEPPATPGREFRPRVGAGDLWVLEWPGQTAIRVDVLMARIEEEVSGLRGRIPDREVDELLAKIKELDEVLRERRPVIRRPL